MIKEIIKRYCPEWIWIRLKLLRLSITLSFERLFFKRRKRKGVYGGLELKLYIADPQAEFWYGQDLREVPAIEFLKQYRLKPGARIFDIGAHQCIHALILEKIVGNTGLVVAVEANAYNVAIAKINKKINNAKQLHIVHAALAERRGKLFFAKDSRGRVLDKSDKGLKVKVPAITIDDLTDRYFIPSMLYIDVEGYECNVLKGASKTLEHYPDCFIEIHAGKKLERFNGSLPEIISFFPKDRYNLFMSSGEDFDKFIPFNFNNDLVKSRFYFIALANTTLPVHLSF